MAGKTFVFLITGFLGSGKTTFLNRVIRQFPGDRKLMILMNEFGEVDVDGTLVEGEDLDMVEISKGSIFCACVKTDFVKALNSIAQTIRPDVLLIESTGVANPSDLKRDLRLSIFKDRFQFQEQFCMIDAGHFLDAYGAYQSIEKQLASSTVFLINKTDTADGGTIARIKEVVREHHPDPVFHETTFAEVDVSHLLLPGETEEAFSEEGPDTPMTPEELDSYCEKLLEDPEAQVTPPDRLLSAVYRWEGESIDAFKKTAGNLPKGIVRSKGFLVDGEETVLFSYVLGDWKLMPRQVPDGRAGQKNLIVFIGSPESMAELAERASEANLSPAPKNEA